MKAEIKAVRSDAGGIVYDLTLKGITVGKLIALTQALKDHDTLVSRDILIPLTQTLQDSKDIDWQGR